MKRLLSLACLISVVTVRAGVIYFDDFQQFPNGTSLTQTNYVPNIGASAEIHTNENGEASTTVVASNFLGSTRAFFRLGSVPYSHQYRGDQTGGDLTNEAVVLTFKLWVEQTKSANSIGGIGINLTTTNIDFIDVNGTNYSHNPLIFINDGGQVFAFTNDPAPPVFNNVQIGSWGTLAGSVMTNVLTLNSPAGTFSFSINGTVLTNGPIPKFVTNIFSRVRIDVFEGLTGLGTFNSAGNKFALDDVRLTSGPASTNLDVKSFLAGAKGQLFEQLSAGTPSMAATGFLFHADVHGFESNSIIAASVQPPTGGSQSLMRDDPSSSNLEFNDQFTTKSALDNIYQSSGTYTMSIDTQNQGTLMPALNLPADAYPNTPQIGNFAAAQSIGSTTNFVVTWSAFTGGNSGDFITFEVDDGTDTSVFSTPDLFDQGALDGTATSVVIPGGTLQPGTAYTGRLLFVKVSNRDTNSVPGAIGATGYFKQTLFPLATTVAPGLSCSLVPALATNDVFSLHTVTATILSNSTAVSGANVDFEIISGPNSNLTGQATTDAGGHADFSYISDTTGIDIIWATSLSTTCTATKVWLLPNVAPVAVCQDVTNAANASCQAAVSAEQVDDASFDIDGNIVNRTLIPAGPFDLGSTPVTLTVFDDRGASNSCSATVVVVDQTEPDITCPAPVITNVEFGVTSAVVNYPAPTITDNCSLTFSDSVPASGSTFPLGTNTITVTAADNAGNTNSCTFNVIVLELPPEPHDLAVVKLKAPKKIKFSSTVTSVVGKFTVSIQNRGPQSEVINNFGILTNLVTVNVQSLSNCPSFFATMSLPKKSFPITLAPKKKLTVSFTATFDCVNDPLATSKTAAHSDYQTVAAVHHEAINPNQPDTFPADDSCPRNPLGVVPVGSGTGTDKGCVPALTDVVVK